jgi:hypothetical protein
MMGIATHALNIVVLTFLSLDTLHDKHYNIK